MIKFKVENIDIENRRPIWMALSEFYLDTGLEDSDFRNIALTITDSPYNLEQVKAINKNEVFPILQPNLLSVAGVWDGFDEDWLVQKITERLSNQRQENNFWAEFRYRMYKWMNSSNWSKLEKKIKEISSNPDTFLLTCRAAFLNNILPFQFEKSDNVIYKKLEKIAKDYRDGNQLKEFYFFLVDGQYYINVWAAYFIMELFNLDKSEKLIGLKDDQTILEHCYRLIENNFQRFAGKDQIRNCSYWLEEKQHLL